MELFVALWLLACFIPAQVAMQKGRSMLGFFLMGVFLTPILALIVALIIDPARDFG